MHVNTYYSQTSHNVSGTNTVEQCSPLQRNLACRMCPIFLRFILRGFSHLAPLVSIGCVCRYSDNHRKLQSQMNGFLARCLKRENKVVSIYLSS